jgi:tRNA threonylcarbamoyladenosine biosynthesis protein TsaB
MRSHLIRILNIETATDICSICISRDRVILAQEASREPFQHAAKITLLIKACLEKAEMTLADIDAIAVSRGPGSYTALRIGISVAKGIAYALDKPVMAVDTLQSLALATADILQKDGLYYPMIDARRMEVYTAPFDRSGKPLAEAASRVISEESFREEIDQGQYLILSGNGAAKCKAVLPSEQVIYQELSCDSAHLVSLAHQAFEQGDFVDIAYFTPFYLKPPNITIAKKKL